MYSKFHQTSTSPYQAKVQFYYPQDIQCVIEPVNATSGGIFISNLEAAQSLKTLKKHNIKAVLTACSGIFLNHPKSEIPYFKYVPGQDHERFDLSKYFDESIQFIQQHLGKTNVLVHCMAGISRSVTLVLAYLIKKKGHSYQSSHRLIKSKRNIIRPNPGFVAQLKKLQRSKTGNNENNRAAILSESNYEIRRYESPMKSISNNIQDFSKKSLNSSKYLRQSSLNHKKTELSQTELKYSQYKNKQSYQNQEELDRRIEQIRKKYEKLSNNYVIPSEKKNPHTRHLSTYENSPIILKYQSININHQDRKKINFYESSLISNNYPIQSTQKLKKMMTMNERNNTKYF